MEGTGLDYEKSKFLPPLNVALSFSRFAEIAQFHAWKVWSIYQHIIQFHISVHQISVSMENMATCLYDLQQ